MNTRHSIRGSARASNHTAPAGTVGSSAALKTPWASERLETVPDFASYVCNLRLRAGLTRKQLAQRAGLSESSLARFELGRTMDYPVGRLLRLLRALGARLEAAPARSRPDLAILLEEVKSGQNTGPASR